MFLDFCFGSREKYPSFLEVELGFTNKSSVEIPRKHFSRAPWEREVGKVSFTEEVQQAKALVEEVA